MSDQLLKKIRKLEISTRHFVNDVLAGDYHSVFRGQGINFADIREYVHGDDIRFIDWNISARLGSPYVKLFTEERELTVYLLVDMSASHLFASTGQLKQEIITEIAAVLGFSAIRNNDKVSLLLATNTVERFIPAKKGRSHIFRILQELVEFRPKEKKGNLAEACTFLARVAKKRGIVFVLSDFLDQGFENAFQLLSRRHDVIPIVIRDRLESQWPSVGRVQLQDLETGQQLLINMADPKVRNVFSQQMKENKESLIAFFKKIKKSPIFIETQSDYFSQLRLYFEQRKKRLRP